MIEANVLALNQAYHSAAPNWEGVRRSALRLDLALVRNPHVHLGGTPLCARGGELQKLSQWLDESSAKVVSIIGPGGQGKSALAWTFFEQVRARVPAPVSKLIWYGFPSGGIMRPWELWKKKVMGK
jgi:hypothetical protein